MAYNIDVEQRRSGPLWPWRDIFWRSLEFVQTRFALRSMFWMLFSGMFSDNRCTMIRPDSVLHLLSNVARDSWAY